MVSDEGSASRQPYNGPQVGTGTGARNPLTTLLRLSRPVVPQAAEAERTALQAKTDSETLKVCTPYTAPAELSELVRWVYELLDAHRDTAWLAADLEDEPEWRAHLDYLRDLQRHGREALARIRTREGSDFSQPGA
jgi:hypothetical protein